jgi:hypothetical protein
MPVGIEFPARMIFYRSIPGKQKAEEKPKRWQSTIWHTLLEFFSSGSGEKLEPADIQKKRY